jgi:D-alanyl-lipoteichoic acid acyltransferase DltB (MBOAT superfamily)
MPFNSFTYLLFLPIVYLFFHIVGERARWLVLFAASLLFYTILNVPYLLVVLVLVAVTTYSFGIWLDLANTATAKWALLLGGITANVLILVVMKYLPFFSENLEVVSTLLSLDTHAQPLKAFVAIGVSYYVFQAISYLTDIYLEIEKPERHFGYFFLYLAFFPKLLQGPIERVGDLLPQLKARYEFRYDNMRLGLVLFAWGLFKKIVIADRLGLFVDAVYNDVHTATGLTSLLATYAYAFQIYMDFSGYTDMALGSALLFNINLTQNFNNPYLSISVADFWRRWHISFSRWILDYIFKPLQMRWRYKKNWGTAAALVVTFLVSGIWHGARWGFVIWGMLHGLYLACSVFYRPLQKWLHKVLSVEKTWYLKLWRIFVTFNLVSFAWVFFRAKSLDDSFTIIGNIVNFSFNGLTIRYLRNSIGGLGITQADIGILLLCTLYMAIVSFCNLKANNFEKLFSSRNRTRWTFYVTLCLIIIMLARMEDVPFLYFRF